MNTWLNEWISGLVKHLLSWISWFGPGAPWGGAVLGRDAFPVPNIGQGWLPGRRLRVWWLQWWVENVSLSPEGVLGEAWALWSELTREVSELPDALELWPRFPFHKHDDEASGHRLRFVHVFSCFYIIKLMKEEENKVANKYLYTNLFNNHGNANLNKNEMPIPFIK